MESRDPPRGGFVMLSEQLTSRYVDQHREVFPTWDELE